MDERLLKFYAELNRLMDEAYDKTDYRARDYLIRARDVYLSVFFVEPENKERKEDKRVEELNEAFAELKVEFIDVKNELEDKADQKDLEEKADREDIDALERRLDGIEEFVESLKESFKELGR